MPQILVGYSMHVSKSLETRVLGTKLLPHLIVVHLFYALDAHVVEDIAEEALMLLKYMAAELAAVELAVELEMREMAESMDDGF